ncbi:MAG: isoprenyl transferase [Candidatus Omnitrophica bacterium]|nr:isoprenyl transferase [Candidatus Omnitrophota bacterium]
MNNKIDIQRLPNHVAIIMDGNGRWAEQQNLSRTQGHIAGVKRVEEIIDYASEIGIKAVTLYTFSSENWNRPSNEVSTIMNIVTAVLNRKIKKLKENNMRFRMIGREAGLPQTVLDAIKMVENETKDNTGLNINLAFNYGSRIEIVDAVKKISESVKNGSLKVEEISEDTINQSLYTRELPDPDLLIRTSGEKRISNFLLWQLSYAELYFTEKFWPDFDAASFDEALIDYQNRQRRFGNLLSQEKINE